MLTELKAVILDQTGLLLSVLGIVLAEINGDGMGWKILFFGLALISMFAGAANFRKYNKKKSAS